MKSETELPVNQKSAKGVRSNFITLDLSQESSDLLPIENRIPHDMEVDQVFKEMKEMNFEALVFNLLIPYRNALHCVDENYSELKVKLYESGFSMITSPFIPEYLKFEEEELDGKSYYVKNDFYLISIGGGDWSVFSKSLPQTKIQIDNMLQGTLVLKSLGCDVDIDDYLESK